MFSRHGAALLVTGALITSALIVACSSDDPEDGPVADCAGQSDFTACRPDQASGAASGACLAESCVPLAACGSGGCLGQGPHFVLGDTNVRACYGPSTSASDGEIPCPGKVGSASCVAAAYCGQDGQYGWDVEHNSDARFSTSSTAPTEPVVTDNVTKLVWQGCSVGQTGSGCAGTATLMNWYKADSYCKQMTWGGFDDWVLPDSHELQSMVDYSTTSPAVDLTVFVNTPSRFKADSSQWWKECYWSSSTYAGKISVAWVMMVNNGDNAEGSGVPYHLNDKEAKDWDGCYARCVRRSSPLKTQRFVKLTRVSNQPVVADTVTHLFWQACAAGQSGSSCSGEAKMIDWKSGLAHCEGLSWGGHDDWRLPNVKELRSIVDLSRRSPSIDTAAFPNTPYYGGTSTAQNAGQFWSATARWYNSFALYVAFGSGFSHFYKQTEGRHIRCVRDPG